MNKELESALSVYLGELMYMDENTFDWIEKDKIIRKINAVYELLDIAEKKPTFMDTIKEVVTKATITKNITKTI